MGIGWRDVGCFGCLAPFQFNTIILCIAPGLADRRSFQFQSLFWGGIESSASPATTPGGCNNRVATLTLTSTSSPPTSAESSASGGGSPRETNHVHVGAFIMGGEESGVSV